MRLKLFSASAWKQMALEMDARLAPPRSARVPRSSQQDEFPMPSNATVDDIHSRLP
jgi:hypothetical protein